MRRLTWMLTLLAALAVAPSLVAAGDDAKPTIEELLDNTDDINRGASSVAVMTMQVKTERYERTVTMKAWTKGTEKSLIVIQSPAKEKGVATLKVDDNIWNYMPKIDRTVKVPANMMSGSWMGSHVTNDDLVRENRLAEEFDAVMTEEPQGGEGRWVIELTPKPDAAVVWGKIVAEIRPDRVPQEIRYYDEKGALVRTMSYGEPKEISGRLIPMSFTVTPADKPGEFTRFSYDSLEFDVDIPDSTFSLQALRQ
ncbi:MAG: outer membrane lipoprotein-sorting protein [Alphaproteobacteria bacterium]|nr:outer membrane lipoprotein-sorting protein [Alphaproteobacteria bacterium]